MCSISCVKHNAKVLRLVRYSNNNTCSIIVVISLLFSFEELVEDTPDKQENWLQMRLHDTI